MYEAAITVFHRTDIADLTLIAPYCGARQGELLKLKKRDVDFALNTIHIGGLPEETKGCKLSHCSNSRTCVPHT